MVAPLPRSGVVLADRPCPRCRKDTRQEISRRIASNNTESYGWWCVECHWWTPAKSGGTFIRKDDLLRFGVDFDAVPTVVIEVSERCSRCGGRGAELHHWAPKGFFGADEAEKWPKDYLCRSCHMKWHDLVTPGLVDQ